MANAVVITILLVVVLFALSGAKKRLKGGCCGGGGTVKIKPKDSRRSHYDYKTIIYIEGMSCENCKTRVENAFNALPDCFVRVSLKKGCAEVYGKAPLSSEKIAEKIAECGYTFAGFEEGGK